MAMAIDFFMVMFVVDKINMSEEQLSGPLALPAARR